MKSVHVHLLQLACTKETMIKCPQLLLTAGDTAVIRHDIDILSTNSEMVEVAKECVALVSKLHHCGSLSERLEALSSRQIIAVDHPLC